MLSSESNSFGEGGNVEAFISSAVIDLGNLLLEMFKLLPDELNAGGGRAAGGGPLCSATGEKASGRGPSITSYLMVGGL